MDYIPQANSRVCKQHIKFSTVDTNVFTELLSNTPVLWRTDCSTLENYEKLVDTLYSAAAVHNTASKKIPMRTQFLSVGGIVYSPRITKENKWSAINWKGEWKSSMSVLSPSDDTFC